MRQSPPVRRILFDTIADAVAIIPLGRNSRSGSSHLPAASPSRFIGCLFGVAPRRDCPFHPARTPPRKRDAGPQPTRLCCSDPHLTVGRCYLLRRSVESGRSSWDRSPQRSPGGLCRWILGTGCARRNRAHVQTRWTAPRLARRSSRWPAIFGNGSTQSTPPAAIASRGMPNTMQVASSCAML